QKLRAVEEVLRLTADSPEPVWVTGPPGVGKTHFALELAETADWSQFALYWPRAHEAAPFLEGLINDGERWLYAIVDDVDTAQGNHILEVASHLAHVRVVLLSTEPPPMREVALTHLLPLAHDECAELLRTAFPGIPDSHVYFASRLSDGYVGMALSICRA